MDPVLCLEHEVRKAQTNSESVVAVFLDIEKAYDMMWRDGLLIKLCKLGIRGRMYGWIMDFFKGATYSSEDWEGFFLKCFW